MYRHLTIDPEHNRLLCCTSLVGKGEIVEVFSQDPHSPPQATCRILKKIKEPNIFTVHVSFDGGEAVGREYEMGEQCIFRVLKKNIAGKRKRKFSTDEKSIIDLEHDVDFVEHKVVRAKTGSVRAKK
jgi:hypothetical protein